ncbi:MAG: hypothetical protein U1F17_15660 [Burkholderiaceae bacterium]
MSEGWVARDAAGRTIGEAAVAILANAGDAARLSGMGLARAAPRARTEHAGRARADRRAARRAGGDAYAAPLATRSWWAPASTTTPSLEPSADIDAGNLDGLRG